MEERAVNKAYIISVSAGTGCYRHIKIGADAALEALSCEILDAFAFANDHAHAFFMDNRAWSDRDSYFMDLEDFEDEDEQNRHTDDYSLMDAGLRQGKKFLYIFDFGQEWRFQCSVLRVLDEQMENAEVIRSVGEPPEQY